MEKVVEKNKLVPWEPFANSKVWNQDSQGTPKQTLAMSESASQLCLNNFHCTPVISQAIFRAFLKLVSKLFTSTALLMRALLEYKLINSHFFCCFLLIHKFYPSWWTPGGPPPFPYLSREVIAKE